MTRELRKIVLTTGGTGGHIFPALAVAEELRRLYPGAEILFIGGEQGPEEAQARQAGLEFVALPVRGFFGRGLKAVAAGFRLLRGIGLARRKIREFQPDIVIGFGGYAAAASVFAGWSRGVPTMIHEQNSVPGIANRLLGRLVDRVCISLPDAASWFKPGKTVLTGNPMRKSIRRLYEAQCREFGPDPKSGKDCSHMLVLGGSQGAKALNSAVLADLPRLVEAGIKVRIQAGAKDYARVAEELEKAGYPDDKISAAPFIDDMEEAYGWADIAVCRAGATTVAELAVAGLPAIFVPFPFATHNHQLHNARQVEKVGAAEVIEQKDIQPGQLADLVGKLCAGPQKLKAMSESARLLANPEAAEKTVKEALKIVDLKKG